MPGFAAAAGVTMPPIQMYMFGLAGGPRRPTVPTLGLNVVAPAGLLVARRHSADVALKAIGIVEPGCAWMLVSWVGSVKLMFTKALPFPVTCHSPAAAWLGATVVATPLGTDPKFSCESVAIVIPTVTTTASAEMVAAFCPATGCVPAAARTPSTIPSRRGVTELAPRPKDRKSTRLNSSHANNSYAVFGLKK